MKAENIQSNTSAPTLAGRQFGTFLKDKDKATTARLLEDAQKIHTVEDIKHYCDGAKETMGKTEASAKTMASMMRTILKVATANDDTLCTYHKVKTPAQGQKVVKAQIEKGFTGLDSLSKALRVPSAPKVESESEGESEVETETGYVNKADEWWDACIKLGHSEKFGLTTDEMMARIAEIVAK
jgi:hypothetical protein